MANAEAPNNLLNSNERRANFLKLESMQVIDEGLSESPRSADVEVMDLVIPTGLKLSGDY